MRVVFPDENHGPLLRLPGHFSNVGRMLGLPCSESHLLGAWQLSVWSYSHQASYLNRKPWKSQPSKWQKENWISKKTMQTANHPFFSGDLFFHYLFILAGKRFPWLTTARHIAVSRDSFGLLNLPLKRQGLHTTNNLETHHLGIDGWFYIKLLPLLMILPWFFLTDLKKFSAWNISNRWHPRYGWLLRKRLSLSVSFLQPSGKKEKSRVSHEKRSFLLSIETRRIPI